MWIHVEQSGQNQNRQRGEFANREYIYRDGDISHAEHIDEREGHGDGADDTRTRKPDVNDRPKQGQIAQHDAGVRRECGKAGDPNEPAPAKPTTDPNASRV